MTEFPQLQIRDRAAAGNLVAWLTLNNACNWKTHAVTPKRPNPCAHCYLPEHQSGVPVTEAVNVVNKLTAKGIVVVPAAGEITQNPNHFAVYSAAGARHLLTNGLNLASAQGENIIEAIASAGIEQVGFTLHESGNNNELNGVPPEIVNKAVAKVLKAGLTPTATVVITREKITRLSNIVNLAIDIGFKMVKFNRLIPTRRELIGQTPTPDDTRRFFELLDQEKSKHPKSLISLNASGLFGFAGRNKSVPDDYYFCPAGRELVAIDTSGRIFPCLLLMQSNFQIGNMDKSTGDLKIDDNPFTRGEYGKRECSAYELLFLNSFNRQQNGGGV